MQYPRSEILVSCGVPSYIIKLLQPEEMMPFWTEVVRARTNQSYFKFSQEQIMLIILGQLTELRSQPTLTPPDPVLEKLINDGVPRDIAIQLKSEEYPYFWYDYKIMGAIDALTVVMKQRLHPKTRRTRLRLVR